MKKKNTNPTSELIRTATVIAASKLRGRDQSYYQRDPDLLARASVHQARKLLARAKSKTR